MIAFQGLNCFFKQVRQKSVRPLLHQDPEQLPLQPLVSRKSLGRGQDRNLGRQVRVAKTLQKHLVALLQ